MQIKYQEKGYGNMSGASLLRQMQNDHTPTLDLLIRESVQNSLDAALPDSRTVNISVLSGVFETRELSPFFQGIENDLNSAFTGQQQFISIQDTGTTGLTGPLSLEDVKGSDFGNLQKLVYQIAKPQEKEGSGGSWGIGKTVYFRVGIGMVIYYSRIWNEVTQRYEDRLAATAVENEKDPVLLKSNPNDTGIAWWGKPDEKMKSRDGTVPLVNDLEIYKLLDVFRIPRMSGAETGTVIIIPFINSKKLLQETIMAEEAENEVQLPFWKKDISDFMKVGLQKWYCPRLDNDQYDGPYLQAFVNGEKIQREEYLPLFSLIKALYNGDEFFGDKKIESEEIQLRGTFNPVKSAGTLRFIKVDQNDMRMGIPDRIPSPYICIDEVSAMESHEPILAYCRKPGMIVSYETDSDWTHSMPVTDGSEFIIGLFRSSSDALLKEELQTKEVQTLEDYLRKSEAADHMGWTDVKLHSNGQEIVRKVKNNIKKKFKTRFSAAVTGGAQKRNLGLGRKIGEMFLPPENSEYWDKKMGGSKGNGGGSGGEAGDDGGGGGSAGNGSNATGFGMRLNGFPKYYSDEVQVPVVLFFGSQTSAKLSILLKTDGGSFTPDKWKKVIGTKCPANINSVEIQKIQKESNDNPKGKGKKKKTENQDSKISASISKDSVIQGVDFRFQKGAMSVGGTALDIEVPEKAKYRIYAIIRYSIDGFEGILDFSKNRIVGSGKEIHV